MHKPDNLSFDEAASLGVGIATIGQAMYWIMKMRLPSLDGTLEPIAGPAVFVYGGSSATGSLAIQAAKLYASPIHTTYII
jgi:NADPH:quinone reductase-like Zn-dependent oxidoreductase